MSNLLPREKSEMEWNRFQYRALLILALVLLGSATFSFFTLLPAHIAMQVERSAAERPDTDQTKVLSPAENQVRIERQEVIRSRTLLNTITPIISSTSSPTESINTALSLRTNGIRVDRIAFVAGVDGGITLSGLSLGRENINQYKDALIKSARFKGVSVPVGALVGSEDGRFTITLTGA